MRVVDARIELSEGIDIVDISWGLSLVGRAPALHAGGQEFDSPSLHQILRGLVKQARLDR